MYACEMSFETNEEPVALERRSTAGGGSDRIGLEGEHRQRIWTEEKCMTAAEQTGGESDGHHQSHDEMHVDA